MIFMNILIRENVKYFWGFATEKGPKHLNLSLALCLDLSIPLFYEGKKWSFLNRLFDWEPKTLESMQ